MAIISNRKELKDSVKRLLIQVFGQNFLMTEGSDDSVDFKFDNGIHMCSIVFVGDKFEARVDSERICGTVHLYDESWFLEKIMKISSKGSFDFLIPHMKGQNLGKIWKEKGGTKIRLEFDSETGQLDWSMKTESGERIICINGNIL